MKNTYSTNLDLPKTDLGLLLLRVGFGAMMLTHGIPKLIRLFTADEIQFGDPIGLGPEVSLTLAVFAEAICATLIILGLATRLAAIPLIITMSVAFLIAHAEDPFSTKEKALMYLVVFVVLLITGSGKHSLDHYLLSQKKKKKIQEDLR